MPTAYSYDLTHSRDLAVVPQLANSSLAIHSRWWCIFEAHVAVQCALSVCIAGRPLQLLTGSLKDTLQLKESAVMRVQQDTEKEVRDIAARGVASPILTSLLDQMHQAKQEEAQAKLDVLVAKDSQLIDLDRAECFSAADKKMILAEVDGHRRGIVSLIAGLVRDVTCEGIEADTSELKLGDSLEIDLDEDSLDTPTRLLAFAAWARQRPPVRTLALHRCQLVQTDMQVVLAIIQEGLLRSLQVRRPPPPRPERCLSAPHRAFFLPRYTGVEAE